MKVVTHSRSAVALAALLLAAAPGCNRGPASDDQVTGSVTQDDVRAARADWSQAASEHVDSANAAYRDDDLQGALRHYEAALAAAGDSKSARVTAYFGIYMVQHALGDSVAAAAAMAKAQEIAPEASLMHGRGTGQSAPPTPNDSIHRR